MAPTIPIVDLRAQHLSLKEEMDRAIAEVIESSGFIAGESCRLFEREFGAFCGARAACGVASGSDALYLVLRALGVGSGDEVITTPFTFVATAEAITRTGARVVFADVEPETLNLDPARVEQALTARTRLLLPVHLYGHPADLPALLRLARQRGIGLVEDAAQAHGAEIEGRRVGTFAQAGCFSFYPAKNLGACGDAGMVVSNDPDLVERVRLLANHGSRRKYWHEIEGVSSRLDGLQAAILRVKLRRLEDWNAQRRRAADLYRQALANTPGLTLPAEQARCRAVYHLFTVRFHDRDGLADHLAEKGIATAVHYPQPLHLQEAYRYLELKEGSLPVAERASREVVSLPMYPELTLEQIERVAREVRAYAFRHPPSGKS